MAVVLDRESGRRDGAIFVAAARRAEACERARIRPAPRSDPASAPRSHPSSASAIGLDARLPRNRTPRRHARRRALRGLLKLQRAHLRRSVGPRSRRALSGLRRAARGKRGLDADDLFPARNAREPDTAATPGGSAGTLKAGSRGLRARRPGTGPASTYGPGRGKRQPTASRHATATDSPMVMADTISRIE